jgi:hypothetical protein
LTPLSSALIVGGAGVNGSGTIVGGSVAVIIVNVAAPVASWPKARKTRPATQAVSFRAFYLTSV